MKTTSLVAALALVFAAGAAVAQEATPDAPVALAVTSRAVVQADAAQAVRSGSLHEARQLQAAFDSAPTLRTRDAVRADTLAAIRSGELDRINAEAWGYSDSLPSNAGATRVAGTTR